MSETLSRESLFASGRGVARAVAREYWRRCPGFARATARPDLENAALWGVWKATQTYDPCRGVPWKSWAGLCARSAVLDWLRASDPETRIQRRRGVAPTFEPLDPDRRVAAGEPPDASAERRDLIRAALCGLPRRDRLAVRLCWLEGLTQAEAGDALGLSACRVSQLLTRSLAWMRKRLEGL